MKTDVTDAGTLKNEMAITDLCEVYCYYYLVTTFGNIPYSQALNANIAFPKYDDAATVYLDLIKRVQADAGNLDESSGSLGSADMIYSGDPASWKLFANTFLLKLGILLSDSDPATAATTVKAAVAAGVFTSNSQNAMYAFLSSPPYTNQAWVQLVQSGRFDYVGTDVYLKLLGAQSTYDPTSGHAGPYYTDPRTPYYFAENKNGLYLGAPNATGTILYANYSLPSGSALTTGNSNGQQASIGTLANASTPGDLLDYSETEFYLAEATARGFISTGTTAAKYYQSGIDASVAFWTGSTNGSSAVEGYAYPTGGLTDQLHAIALQQYLALYNRGYDAWTVTRRLAWPVLIPPPDAISAFPVRFTYPIKEAQINATNYSSASSAIGGDKVTTLLWFDKNPYPAATAN